MDYINNRNYEYLKLMKSKVRVDHTHSKSGLVEARMVITGKRDLETSIPVSNRYTA